MGLLLLAALTDLGDTVLRAFIFAFLTVDFATWVDVALRFMGIHLARLFFLGLEQASTVGGGGGGANVPPCQGSAGGGAGPRLSDGLGGGSAGS